MQFLAEVETVKSKIPHHHDSLFRLSSLCRRSVKPSGPEVIWCRTQFVICEEATRADRCMCSQRRRSFLGESVVGLTSGSLTYLASMDFQLAKICPDSTEFCSIARTTMLVEMVILATRGPEVAANMREGQQAGSTPRYWARPTGPEKPVNNPNKTELGFSGKVYK